MKFRRKLSLTPVLAPLKPHALRNINGVFLLLSSFGKYKNIAKKYEMSNLSSRRHKSD